MQVEAKVKCIIDLERVRLSSRFCTDTQLFLDTLDDELDPSHQDELRKLREDTDFLVDHNSRSNEEIVRSIAGKELWIQVEAKVQEDITVQFGTLGLEFFEFDLLVGLSSSRVGNLTFFLGS